MLPLRKCSRFKLTVLGIAVVAASLALPGKMQAGAFTAGPEPMATVAEVDRLANPLNQQETPRFAEIASAETSNSAGAAAAGFRLSASQQQQMLISGHSGAEMAADMAGGFSARRRAVASQGSGLGSGTGSGGSSGSVAPATGGNNAQAIGTTAANPILPSATINGSYVFNHNGTSAGTPIFFDPPIASGYVFTASGPNFASFTVTTPLPNTPSLTFTFNGASSSVNATSPGSGQFPEFVFPNGGVSQFVLSGISDADIHGQEFTYAFTFVSSAPGSFTQTALSFPEPGGLTLLSVGIAGLLVWRRRGTVLAG
jgi:hypothetical protein